MSAADRTRHDRDRSLTMAPISRRKLFEIGLAAAGVAIGLPGCKGAKPVLITGLLGSAGTGKKATGPIEWVASTCGQCEAACGIRIKTIAGDAIKIEGNPLHPLNAGRLCGRGQAGLQALYDPDRIRGPLERVGPRGRGKWKAISWDEAIAKVAARLSALRAGPGPESLILMRGRMQGHTADLFDRFARAYGTPNLFGGDAATAHNHKLTHALMQGVDAHVAYDWARASTVLAFGANLTETFRPTVHVQNAMALRRSRGREAGKLVSIDPRLSLTASRSDEWVPIRPGTDGALALGLASVIVSEGLHDEAFVARYVAGFERWRDEVLALMPASRAAAITGVEEARIVRLAREFARFRPAIAVAGRGAGMHSNGLFNLMAIHALNALVGSIGAPGGVLAPAMPDFPEWPAAKLDAVAEEGLRQPRLDGAGTRRFPLAPSVASALPEAIVAGRPYPARAILLHRTNPFFSLPDPRRMEAAFDHLELVVSFSPLIDETTALADFVLPDHTYLERWSHTTPLGFARAAVGLGQPAVKPVFDTMASDDVLLRIAKAIGGAVGAAFPWKSGEQVVRERFAAIAGGDDDEDPSWWWELLERGVWVGPEPDKPTPSDAIRTDSGRFELAPEMMRQRLTIIAEESGITLDGLLGECGVGARGEAALLPHWENPAEGSAPPGRPLLLNPYRSAMSVSGYGGNMPWLQETFNIQLGEARQSWVELAPATAREHGVSDGMRVEVSSEVGRFTCRARVFEGVRPGVVNMPYGFGHTWGGRWTVGQGTSCNAVTPLIHDALCGASSRSAAWVSVRPVGEGGA